ncbi:hypothetical protein CPAR01_15757 [Colletotrichum paranaense]|uniref:Uncharacterized protein n=1 Tax=Colletotrichum paranaense TaxID=1914294 RepID=A0ABQ9RXQ4_9PEZI|nr:uncharacterized protein CPAR01_15757 [Colletotrichum paranaense]KAK1518108.1 hypothetical protein CPAR01_15757 [Colletotrichum paranaense]
MTQSELPIASFGPCPSPSPAHAGRPPVTRSEQKPVANRFELLLRTKISHAKAV